MVKRNVCISISILVMTIFYSNAEITYVPLKKAPVGIWDSDSLYLGAEVAVNDPAKPVFVSWKTNQGKALGKLYFMVPGQGDSSRFLFHNRNTEFADDPQIVNIGSFPRGTKLYFMYTVTDTSGLHEKAKNKKLYSGQNRQGTDQFVSEIKGVVDYRWAVAGRTKSDTCEMSFGSIYRGDFRQIRFYVSNTYLIK